MLNSKSIGNKIAEARKRIHLSQSELAQQVSISPQAVGKWERGESMPDITTLSRLAEILGVDLNYFSENFPSTDPEDSNKIALSKNQTGSISEAYKKKLSWDMSKLNLVDSDFSGLKNLHDKFNAANMQNCKFIGSDMAGLLLKSNHVDSCDFSGSNFGSSQIQNSFFNRNTFSECSLKDLECQKSYFTGCDFSGADLSGTVFKSGGFEKNTLTNAILNRSSFIEMHIQDIVFEGSMEDCIFENCTFYKGVKFQNASLTNTFFKNNQKFKRVQFINCKVDQLTHAFLKNNRTDLTGITLMD